MNKEFLTSSTGGQKEVKLEEFALIPVGPLTEVARIYGYGKKKYSARNWEKGYPWSASYSALQRHLNQFWSGEDIDSESGIPHLASAVFHCFALLEFSKTHPEFDDRSKPVRHAFRKMTPDEIRRLYRLNISLTDLKTPYEDSSSKASNGRNDKVRTPKSQTRNSRVKGRKSCRGGLQS